MSNKYITIFTNTLIQRIIMIKNANNMTGWNKIVFVKLNEWKVSLPGELVYNERCLERIQCGVNEYNVWEQIIKCYPLLADSCCHF